MRKRPILAGAVVILAVGAGLIWLANVNVMGPEEIPDDPDVPDRLILFSLNGRKPFSKEDEKKNANNQKFLYSYPLLGEVEITDPLRRREIMAAVNKDIQRGHKAPADCFFPRHILRVIKGGETVDFVICFHCHNYEVHKNGGPHPGLTPSIGDESQEMLNDILAAAKVPIAP